MLKSLLVHRPFISTLKNWFLFNERKQRRWRVKDFFRIVGKQKICWIQRWFEDEIVLRLIISKSLPNASYIPFASFPPFQLACLLFFSVNEIKTEINEWCFFLRVLFSKHERKKSEIYVEKRIKSCAEEGGMERGEKKKKSERVGCEMEKVKFEKFETGNSSPTDYIFRKKGQKFIY